MRRDTTVSLFPKVIVSRTADGNFRGSCGGCNTVAVIVGDDSAMAFKQRHERCPDQVERV
jgi:hypothetical protein